MNRHVLLAAGLVLGLQVAILEAQAAPGGVWVELCEAGLPSENAWPNELLEGGDSYQEVAVAFFRLPRKYNRQGVRADRANPLLLRATTTVPLVPGRHRVLLRSRRAARLWLNEELIAENDFPPKITDGHDPVRRPFLDLGPAVRFASPGDQEVLVTIDSGGGEHTFKLETFVGGFSGVHPLRPELGETLVAVSPPGDDQFWLLSPTRRVPLTDNGWSRFHNERSDSYDLADQQRRRAAQQRSAAYWKRRHEYARQIVAAATDPGSKSTRRATSIDELLAQQPAAELESGRGIAVGRADELAFLRRAYLDVVGVVPTLAEIDAFFEADPRDRRAELIEALLEDPRWADHWVGYWQDVLGENPSIVNPTLNNTGPFRWWIYESLLDNKPLDRFVTELVMMDGSLRDGGPAGFAMATENDVPMAAKANTLAAAFLGVQMKCSRCHDAPYHSNTQLDLFQLAAMLARETLTVPATSSVPLDSLHFADREPLIEVSLRPGTPVSPAWSLGQLSPLELPDEFRERPGTSESTATEDSRFRLAWRITSPHNRRFARVAANRIWRRLMGSGIVEPVDDWEATVPADPRLLDFLADELVANSYDVRHLSRLILNSDLYQSSDRRSSARRRLELPARRRMTAEQIVDSLFVACGKELRVEELNIDASGGRPWRSALNLGHPRRAWQFGGMATNRDRPSLTLPRAQAVIDVLLAFGWRSSRQEAVSYRRDDPNVLQPAMVANGTMSRWLTTLSDDHQITALCLADDCTVAELMQAMFLRILTRDPTPAEQAEVGEFLADGFQQRRRARPGPDPTESESQQVRRPPLFVTWANHLEPQATTIKLAEAEAARRGDPPTDRLEARWRNRVEDVLWALLNLPETIHYQ